jgi:DNA-binding NtrC family response regulator
MSKPDMKSSASTARRKALIYIVDDEPLLSDLAEASLQPAECEVKQFQDPELALKTFLAADPKPDLILSDYAMDKMNGLELIQKCKAAKPDLKAILISGTAGADILIDAPVKVERFLGKPYQPAALLELARAVLAS